MRVDVKHYWPWIIVFGCFLIMNVLYLHRVPGLLGDEGSEGENVYELLQADHLTVLGERSYIGPWIDYVRVPFMGIFGYTTLGVRIPILLFSLVTFLLAAAVLRRVFDDHVALLAVTFLVFSPAYIAYQRLGWVITLFPFFVFLILWLGLRDRKHMPLLAGVAAGVGLSTHIMFFPSLLASSVLLLPTIIRRGWRQVLSWWPAVIGFFAGFGMQLVVLMLMKEDQGDVDAATSLFAERVNDVITALPLYLSGSGFVAAYTGTPFSFVVIWWIVALIFGLAAAAFLLPKKKMVVTWLWIGLVVQLVTLLYMIDRYTLRYFLVPTLWLWMLAGIGLAALFTKLPRQVSSISAVVVAVGLSTWMILKLFVPFLATGGSTAEFSLGNRVDNGAAHVAIEPLVDCIAQKGPVFSESIHIWNRLQYLSHSDDRIEIVSEEDKTDAKYLISYRLSKDTGLARDGEICPDLVHFRVVERIK